MKVNQEVVAKTDHRPQQHAEESKQNFGKIVETQSKRLQKTELKGLVEDISTLGERLAKFRSFQDLAKFKRMIKRFLQTAVYDGLGVHEDRGFHRQRMSHLTTVKQVDEKLIELTEDVMDQEKSTVDLLGVIGEIKGLLINIYT